MTARVRLTVSPLCVFCFFLPLSRRSAPLRRPPSTRRSQVLGRAQSAGGGQGRPGRRQLRRDVRRCAGPPEAGRTYRRAASAAVYAAAAPLGHRRLLLRAGRAGDLRSGAQYQVRVQLHGGVMMRETGEPRGRGGRGGAAAARSKAPSRSTCCRPAGAMRRGGAAPQIENLDAILDSVKRTYNVDENRVVLSGVSDGATGAVLRRDARHDAVRELPAAERLPDGAGQRSARRRRRAVPDQPPEQAVLHRQRRPGSAVPDPERRSRSSIICATAASTVDYHPRPRPGTTRRGGRR